MDRHDRPTSEELAVRGIHMRLATASVIVMPKGVKGHDVSTHDQ